MLKLEPGKVYRYYTPSFLNLPQNEEASYKDYISTQVREEITPKYAFIDRPNFFKRKDRVLTETIAT